MIRKLRTKLVAAAMLSLLAVLTVILGVILLTNYRGIVSDADRILDLLADNQGKFPEIKADFDWEELGPRHRSVELGYETRYFSVLLDRQGTVLATDTGKIAAVDEETAASTCFLPFSLTGLCTTILLTSSLRMAASSSGISRYLSTSFRNSFTSETCPVCASISRSSTEASCSSSACSFSYWRDNFKYRLSDSLPSTLSS